MTTVAHRPPRGYRTLRLPLAEADYEQFIRKGEVAKGQRDQLYGLHPELFPEAWGQGDVFYGFTAPSRQQQQQRYRRVRLTATGGVFTGRCQERCRFFSLYFEAIPAPSEGLVCSG